MPTNPEEGASSQPQPSVGEAAGSSAKMHDVTMNTYKRIDVPPDDLDTHVVKTIGVTGCDALLVWRTSPDAGDEILLTHYPPTEVERHRQVLREFAPRGEGGTTKVVYLTMGRDNSDWVVKLREDIEQLLDITPEIVSLAGLPSDGLKDMQHDSLLYQLCATKGFNGRPNARRVIVSFPDRNVYESQF